ncbi:hypothetical protein F3Y22_tig00111273pilonHSYRG00118 [Hibiscus syriacus]|uniref:pectinesterase n=1 Tax=Hibiscus syriacus TaxID=106335 RepID=A0A6A2YSY4_HIBSY|nr:hypothetical protein F3Y22_tig00111273pilonHSYRG00118 [Hibiscus syriacus]
MASFIFFLALFTLMVSTPQADAAETSALAILITVDQSGKGDYEKIQDAIDVVPSNNKHVVFILAKPGVYEEKIVVPADKRYSFFSAVADSSAPLACELHRSSPRARELSPSAPEPSTNISPIDIVIHSDNNHTTIRKTEKTH